MSLGGAAVLAFLSGLRSVCIFCRHVIHSSLFFAILGERDGRNADKETCIALCRLPCSRAFFFFLPLLLLLLLFEFGLPLVCRIVNMTSWCFCCYFSPPRSLIAYCQFRVPGQKRKDKFINWWKRRGENGQSKTVSSSKTRFASLKQNKLLSAARYNIASQPPTTTSKREHQIFFITSTTGLMHALNREYFPRIRS